MVELLQNSELGGVQKDFLLRSLNESKNDNLDDASLRRLDESQASLRKVGKAFEGVFLSMLLREMRNTTHPEDGMFGQSSAMQIFQDMQDEEISKQMAGKSGLGVTEKIVQTYGRHLKGDKKEKNPDMPSLNKMA